jgi:uncharacterized protein YjhX (UPF0386 family)
MKKIIVHELTNTGEVSFSGDKNTMNNINLVADSMETKGYSIEEVYVSIFKQLKGHYPNIVGTDFFPHRASQADMWKKYEFEVDELIFNKILINHG